ncbi:MAG: GAF domain-containing protein [Chloroflexota bacterium]
MIIDDEEFSAETIKLILEDAGEAQADYATTYNDARELVQQSLKPNKPYDVFLIDLRLGPGKDGIEFMQELRAASPDTDAIIFTGLEDSAHGVRAYEAGAFRYLYKPFENEELLYLLKAVKQKRKEEQEHDWQRLFTGMMEEALRKTTFLEVANVTVKYALKLGFSRAHLFWVPAQKDANPENRMIGITCAGKGCIPNFSTSNANPKLYPMKQWFNLSQSKQANEVIFFEPGKAGNVQQQAEAIGYRWPKGEIAFLPLWGTNRLLGELMLDHGQYEKKLSKHEYSLLGLFARQVAVVLENVNLINREKLLAQDTAIVNHISRQVMAKAIDEINLSELLDEVHDQIDLLMDVSNFAFFLLDSESNEIDLRLLYERGLRCKDLPHPSSMVIERFLLGQEAIDIFWKSGVQERLRENRIYLEGETPVSCIGVRLQVGEKIVGGITVRRYEGKEGFTKREHELLLAVANQIAGAIQLIHTNEVEKRDAARLEVLRRAMMEMLRIAQENEDDLWLTALTFATAHFGTGFNRALLFLENDDHTLLTGRAGIGANDPGKAQCDWENDRKRGYQFDDFLAELRQKKIHFTDLHTLAHDMVFQPARPNSIIYQSMQDGQQKIVRQDKVEECLPREITDRVELGECAVLPIPSGDHIIGVAIVDNKHNGRPLSEKMLNHLQTLLNYTGLVWETLRQQKKSNRLLSANYTILSGATPDQLKTTLQEICETAQAITEADWVIVYPLVEGTEVFDIQKISYAGNIKIPLENVVKEKRRKKGVSAHVLSEGELVIKDIDREESVIGTNRLANHHFIQQEGVKSLIGIAIRDVLTDQNLGVLYLDYRKACNFTEQEIHHARSFASLAAVAIANSRRYGEQRHQERLKVALEAAQIINTGVTQDEILDSVLGNLNKIFPETSMCILSYDNNENALRFIPATLKYYPIPKSKISEKRIFPLNGPSIACKTAREALEKKHSIVINVPDVSFYPEYLKLIPQNRSELCISLMGSNHELLGILAMERATTLGFSDDDQALVETVASQLSLGMERTHQNEQLSFKTTVAALTSWAADIAHDINNEAGEIQGYTYLIKELVQDNEQLVNYASKIEESAQRLFEAGPKSTQGKQVIPLNQAIRKFGEPLAHQRDIQIRFFLDANEDHIFVNPADFRRVLQHLTRNADKAMRGMGKKKIAIITHKVGNEVEILFRDYGPGVPEEVYRSIFQKSVTTKQSGGYGLLLTRQFVEDMGGTIRLLPSAPGKGATFSIKLPVTKFDDIALE